MQTRSFSRLVSNPSSNPTPSTNSNPKGRNHRRSKQRIEEFNLDEPITVDNFELKHGLLTLVQNKQFFGHEKEDPHAHVRYFNKITSTLKFPNIPNKSIKLMLFPFFLDGSAQIWLEKEPPRLIFTWDDLVSKFINQFFPPSKTTNLHNEITNFQQRFDKMPRECLTIIKSKSKGRYSRNKPVVAKVSMSTFTSGISPDVAELKDMVKALLLDKKSQNQSPALVKAVKESCVTCGGILPSNTIANPRSDLKAITTQSGVSYDRPQILPSPSFLPKVVENESEATEDTVNPTNNGSTEDVQPHDVQSDSLILNFEPVISLISEPVIAPIFKDMSFKISFADALILMPKFASTLKSLIGNKEKLSEIARTPLNEHCSVVLLKKLPEKLGDPGKFLIPCDFPGSFHFSTDFVVVDFDADPRVPLILRRSFVKTGRALIDVFEGELTPRVGKEAISFNLDQTSRYSAIYSDIMEKRIDVIDVACEEYSQEVLGFSDAITSGNPTPYYDPIVFTTYLTLTSFENNDFILEEVDAFLAIEDDPTLQEVYQLYLNPEGDIQVELKDLPPHLEYAFLEGDDKLAVIIAKDLSVEEKTALIMILNYFQIPIDPKDQEKTTFTCPYGTFAYRRMPFGLCNAPGTFQRCMKAIFHDMIEKTLEVFTDDFSVFRNSFQSSLSHLERMLKRCEDTNLCLNWKKSHFMVKEDWDMPFELMCDASDFAIGAVLGQRQDKHFRPIHYASKTMTKAESNYTTTEKEMFAVVYAFEKFRSYLIMYKSILYTDHSALKYLFANKDSKARLLR
nr:reverse transcriptase domain-containing protein [Tanacetum cinerariifolium]